MTVSVHHGELHLPDVQALLAAHVAAMRAQSPADACHVMTADALDHEAITFFSARRSGRLLGIGALKALGPAQGEVKSMRTAAEAQRQGVGKALLAAIIAEARRRGDRTLSLETGRSADFAAANALYEQAGFVECAAFGGYPAGPFTRFLSLEL